MPKTIGYLLMYDHASKLVASLTCICIYLQLQVYTLIILNNLYVHLVAIEIIIWPGLSSKMKKENTPKRYINL